MIRTAAFLFLVLLQWSLSAPLQAAADYADPELRTLLQATIAGTSSFEDRYDAEVWLVDMSGRLERYIKDPKTRLRILRQVHREAARHNLQPELVLAVMHTESLFDPFAISHAGALGLMQVMPFWVREIGRPDDNLHDITTNIRYGTTILSFYLSKERGDLVRGLARYNGSLGKTWYAERVFRNWERHWFVN